MRSVLIFALMLSTGCNQSDPAANKQTVVLVAEEDCLYIQNDLEMLACFEKLNAQTEANIEHLQNENDDLDREIEEGFGLQVEDE